MGWDLFFLSLPLLFVSLALFAFPPSHSVFVVSEWEHLFLFTYLLFLSIIFVFLLLPCLRLCYLSFRSKKVHCAYNKHTSAAETLLLLYEARQVIQHLALVWRIMKLLERGGVGSLRPKRLEAFCSHDL